MLDSAVSVQYIMARFRNAKDMLVSCFISETETSFFAFCLLKSAAVKTRIFFIIINDVSRSCINFIGTLYRLPPLYDSIRKVAVAGNGVSLAPL
jgi:hypothetical protein